MPRDYPLTCLLVSLRCRAPPDFNSDKSAVVAVLIIHNGEHEHVTFTGHIERVDVLRIVNRRLPCDGRVANPNLQSLGRLLVPSCYVTGSVSRATIVPRRVGNPIIAPVGESVRAARHETIVLSCFENDVAVSWSRCVWGSPVRSDFNRVEKDWLAFFTFVRRVIKVGCPAFAIVDELYCSLYFSYDFCISCPGGFAFILRHTHGTRCQVR